MRISEVLLNLQAFAKENKVPIVRDITGQILSKEIKKHQPKKILEIGTAIGYSGLLMLNECPTAKLVTIEKDEERYNLAKHNFEDAGVDAECVLGDAIDILQDLVNKKQKFDFVFLDGPKGFYFRYLQLIKKLINNNACIFADNVGFFGMVKSGIYPHRHKTIVVSLQNYLKEVTNSPFKSQVELDIDDGYAITMYKGEDKC